MKSLTSRDIRSAVITGLTTGIIGWRVLVYLGHGLPFGLHPLILVLAAPVAWIAGVQFGYALGTLFSPFIQFGRFVAIGFANAAVDFGVLYLLIAASGRAEGIAYSIFKAMSFAVATAHSYYWNKNWTFEASSNARGQREITSFISVALVSLLVNVAVASIVVASRPAGAHVPTWAGIGAVAGAATAIIISFVGFRVFVFKKK